jgi:hypothetical protein
VNESAKCPYCGATTICACDTGYLPNRAELEQERIHRGANRRRAEIRCELERYERWRWISLITSFLICLGGTALILWSIWRHQ